MKPLLFISHGAGRDPEVQQVLDVLVPALEDLGYEVFVDVESLRVGDEWNDELYSALYRCDAAIVLLGPNTIGMNCDPGGRLEISEWVRRESEVLVGRFKVHGLRTILPGLVGGATTSVARSNGFASLLSIQTALAPVGADEACAPPDAVAKRILDEISPASNVTGAVGLWAQRIADFLQTARSVNEDCYIAAAGDAGLTQDELFHIRAKIGSELFLANRLLSGDLHPHLDRLITRLRPTLGGDRLQHFADEVLPAWVDPSAAHTVTSGSPVIIPHPRVEPDRLAETPADASVGCLPCQVVVLEATQEWTAEQYVQRGVCRAPRSYSLQAVPAELPADERSEAEILEDQCRQVLRGVFRVPPGFPMTPETVRPEPGMLHCLVLNAAGRRSEDLSAVMDALHRDFPWLVVIALTGGTQCSEQTLRSAGSQRVVTVRPQLTFEGELAAYRLKCNVDAAVKSSRVLAS